MFISPDELKEKLDSKENIFLLDVRNPEECSWKIEGSVNVPLYEIKNRTEEVPKDKEIIAICAHGQRSQMAANFLKFSGYNVASLVGGMAAWNTVYDIVPIYYKDGAFGLYQMKRIGKGCISYLLISQGKMCVIDPSYYTEKFIEMSKRFFVPITDIIDTHKHADHISGAMKLGKETNAKVYLNSEDDYAFNDFIDLKEKKIVQVGNTIIEVLRTPGHTLGSVCLLIDNKFLLSGDTLFTDGFARPDLGGDASLLYDSYQSLFKLNDNITVLPSHYKSDNLYLGSVISDVIGDIKENKLYNLPKEEFIQSFESMPLINHMEDILNINKSLEQVAEDEAMELEFGANKCVVNSK